MASSGQQSAVNHPVNHVPKRYMDINAALLYVSRINSFPLFAFVHDEWKTEEEDFYKCEDEFGQWKKVHAQSDIWQFEFSTTLEIFA